MSGLVSRAREAGSKVASLGSKAKEQVISIEQRAQQVALEKARLAQDHARTVTRNRMRSVAERSVDWAINRSAATFRASLVEESAPRVIRDLAHSVFDALWPDVAFEIKENVLVSIHESIDGYAPAWQEPAKVGGLRAVRAWFLYSFQPFDASGFRQLRWPSYWLLLAWSACPYYGAQGVFWLVMFVLMDRSDEYTLVNFALSFKALQFVTLGFAGLLVGCATYHLCLTADIHRISCDTDGPGQQRDFFFQFGAFWLQSTLVWAAFLLLPYSARYAGSQAHAIDEAAAVGTLEDVTADANGALPPQPAANTTYREDAGGYLRRMVVYDVLCFALVSAWVCAYGAYAGALTAGGQTHWQFRATCFFAKTVYGLLSFPFIPFVLPPFNSILTHAKPTAYDQAGTAVPLLSARERAEKERVERGEPARPPPKPGVYANVKSGLAHAGGALKGAGSAARNRALGMRGRGQRAAEAEIPVDAML